MQLSALRAQVQNLVGDLDQAEFTNAQILQYLNWGQKEVVRRLMNYGKTASATGSVAGNAVTLPTDFIKETAVFWNGTKLQRIKLGNYYTDGSTADTTTTGTVPTAYEITNDRKLVFWPQGASTASGTYRLDYIGYPTDLVLDTDDSGLPDDLEELIVLYAVYMCKMAENDLQGAAFIRNDIDTRILYFAGLSNDTGAWESPVWGYNASSVSDYTSY